MRKLILYIPPDLARALKVRAAQEDTSMSAFVTALIDGAIKKGGKDKK